MVTWEKIEQWARNGSLQPPRRFELTDRQWRDRLTGQQYEVTRHHATERAFSSQMCSRFDPGVYRCVCCHEPLFDSTSKYHSHSGWPAFHAPHSEEVISYHSDTSHNMVRIEVRCNVCDAHLGHVFPDGPPPTGVRYCINAAALEKEEPSVPRDA